MYNNKKYCINLRIKIESGYIMKKLLNFLGIAIIFVSFVSLQAMEQQRPEVGEGKGEQQEAPRPVKRVRREFFNKPRESFILVKNPKSLKELTAKVLLDQLVESGTTEEISDITNLEGVSGLLKKQAKEAHLSLYNAKNSHEVETIVELNKSLDLKININAGNQFGQTPFNSLISKGILDGAAYLVDIFGKELDVSTPDIEGVTPLQGAIKQQDVGLAEAIIKILIEQNKVNLINTVNKAGEETLILMARYTPVLIPLVVRNDIPYWNDGGKVKNIITILQHGGNFQEELYITALLGKIDEIEAAIAHGANVNLPFPVTLAGDGLSLLKVCILKKVSSGRIQELIKLGAYVNLQDEYGWTALMFAARYNKDAVPLLLAAQGVEVNLQNNNGLTALMIAAQHNKDTVPLLLAVQGIEVNLRSNIGNTALMLAARYNPDTVPLLLAAQGIEVNLQNNNGDTALMVAAQFNKDAVPLLLAAQRVEVNLQNKSGWTALMLAVRYNPDTVPLLLAVHGINVDIQDNNGTTALMIAAYSNKDAVPLLLAAQGIDVNLQNNKGDTALMVAAQFNKDAVQLLLASQGIGVNLQNNKGDTALMVAVRFNKDAVPLLLAAQGVEVNLQTKSGWTALMVAAQHNKDTVPLLLAAQGIEVNLQNNNGDTALMVAVQFNKDTVPLLLAAHGIKVNIQDNNGSTALMWAAQFNKDAVPLLLAAQGVEVNLQNKSGGTALMIAASNNPNAIETLLEAPGIDVNMQDKNGLTALMWAVVKQQSEAVPMLLAAHGIKVNLQDKDGNTALMIASAINPRLIPELIRAGADVTITNKIGATAYDFAVRKKVPEEFLELLRIPQH